MTRAVPAAQHAAIDVERIRADTVGTRECIHLNNAGAGLMPSVVVDAMIEHLQLEARIGGYEAADRQAERIDAVYDDLAALVGARRQEIAIMENATVAWDHAFYALDLQPGDRVLTCEAEYAANYVAFLQRSRKDGVRIDVIPSGIDGALDLAALENLIDERTALIAITWIPTNGGLMNPAREVGEIAARYRVPYLLDACQALGQIAIDVRDLNCDFLSATGRKFLRGPRGTGLLYVREQILDELEPAMIDHFGAAWVSRDTYRLRSDARRFETWENAYALRLGLGEAARYACAVGMTAIEQRTFALADALRAQLKALRNVKVWDRGPAPCAIIGFSVAGHDSADIVAGLHRRGINASVSPPSSTRLDAEARGVPPLVRVSPHYYNTEQELRQFVEVLNGLIGA